MNSCRANAIVCGSVPDSISSGLNKYAEMRAELIAELEALVKEVDVVAPRRRHPRHIPVPHLGRGKRLSLADQWASLIWSIDTAQEHGKGALKGVSLSLARMIQAQALEALLLDARHPVRSRMSVDNLLWSEDVVLDSEGGTLKSLRRKMRRGSARLMSESLVFPEPWERTRFIKATGNIGEGLAHGVWRQDPNHFGVEWRPWPIFWVSNGNHSTMAGLVKSGANFRPYETYDLSPVLRAVKTDGLQWYRSDTNQPFEAVSSMAMAGVFVVGQRLIGLKRAGHSD